MKITKNAVLLPGQTCEYGDGCTTKNCTGKDKNRASGLSCALRRGLLQADGYIVSFKDSAQNA